ncbi:hypothetical protein QOZ86_14280 [Blastococcus capsensis]|nr:hypothetical protein [Blastococcus capsensis]MDK3257671.1 hypothetical protein [Blastococcus capsensis]
MPADELADVLLTRERSSPSSSTTRTSAPQIGLPIERTFRSFALASNVVVLAVSGTP